MAYQTKFGWYSSTQIPGRLVSTEPNNTSETTTPGELRANWTGHTWVDLPYVTEVVPPTPTPNVPQSVTRRQAKQALLLAGLLPNVQTIIDAIPDATQKAMVQLEWDESLTFERNRPLLISLATSLGLDSDGLDQLFITANTL